MAVLGYVRRHPATRYTTPRRALVAAVVFLIPAPWAALDVPKSIEEYRILQSLSYCSGADPESGPGCLASEEVTFEGPPSHLRRSALEEWYATDDDDQLVVFDLQPAYAHYADTLPGPGFVYRVNGEIVAVAKADSTEYATTAMSGSHAIAFDVFVLLMLLGMSANGARTTIAGRRAGVAWSDKIPPQVLRRHGPDHAVAATGVSGLFTTFILALTGAVAWVAPLLVGAAVWVYPTAQRLVRQRRGDGQHAA